MTTLVRPARTTLTAGSSDRQRSPSSSAISCPTAAGSVTLHPIAARIAVLVAALNRRSSPR
jgi:hypothetical protein